MAEKTQRRFRRTNSVDAQRVILRRISYPAYHPNLEAGKHARCAAKIIQRATGFMPVDRLR